MRFHTLALVASFTVGLIFMMLQLPARKVVIKFPTPDTADEHLYTGANGQCYRIGAEEQDCSASKRVSSQPVGEEYDLEE